MKLTFLFSVIIVSSLFIGCGQKQKDGSGLATLTRTVDATQFHDLIESKKGLILDVRTPEETATGILVGAQKIDFFGNNFELQVDKLDKRIPVFLYCASGNRSGQAMLLMEQKGFKEVYNLAGGIGTWENKGYPCQNNI